MNNPNGRYRENWREITNITAKYIHNLRLLGKDLCFFFAKPKIIVWCYDLWIATPNISHSHSLIEYIPTYLTHGLFPLHNGLQSINLYCTNSSLYSSRSDLWIQVGPMQILGLSKTSSKFLFVNPFECSKIPFVKLFDLYFLISALDFANDVEPWSALTNISS